MFRSRRSPVISPVLSLPGREWQSGVATEEGSDEVDDRVEGGVTTTTSSTHSDSG